MADTGTFVRNQRTGKEIIGRFVLRAIAALVILAALVFGVDYGVLRIRIATNHAPFGTVNVHPYYAVPQKDQKTQFILGDPTDQQCVNSLFPHMGDSPCWYLTKHVDQQINM